MTAHPDVEPADTNAFDYTLHDGVMPVQVQWYFRERTTLPVAVNRWTFPPGATEGLHTHPVTAAAVNTELPALEELYVLISGQVTMLIGDERVELFPGDAVRADPHTPRGVRNDSGEPAEFLVVWGQSGQGLDWTPFRMGRLAAAASEPPEQT